LVKRNYELDPNEYHGGVVHEGHLGWLDNALQEYNYTAMQDEPIKEFTLNQGGWLGITDKYWMVAIAPEQNVNAKGRFLFSRQNGVDGHQSDYIGEAQTIAAGQSVTVKNYLFAGAKVVSTIE